MDIADFGEATFAVTKYMKAQLLVYEIAENPGFYYSFEKKSSKRLANDTEKNLPSCFIMAPTGLLAGGGNDTVGVTSSVARCRVFTLDLGFFKP